VDDDLERARPRVGAALARTGVDAAHDWLALLPRPGGELLLMPDYLTAYATRVPPAAARLHGVSLECRDALEVVHDYGKHPNVLLYCDPPYLASSRNSTNYRHEMAGETEHRALAEALSTVSAAVVLSGYASPLYEDLYDGWARIEMSAWTGNGIRDGATKTDGIRTEVLWSNRAIGERDLFSDLEVTA
jgi:DNA adenine methylase